MRFARRGGCRMTDASGPAAATTLPHLQKTPHKHHTYHIHTIFIQGARTTSSARSKSAYRNEEVSECVQLARKESRHSIYGSQMTLNHKMSCAQLHRCNCPATRGDGEQGNRSFYGSGLDGHILCFPKWKGPFSKLNSSLK
jgi:hypothetical protein